MNLRKLARGRDCTVQLDGICNHDSSTVVLHHIRKTGLGGMSKKPPDEFGVFVCANCHAAIHRQIHPNLEADYLELEELRGWRRTRAILWEEGVA